MLTFNVILGYQDFFFFQSDRRTQYEETHSKLNEKKGGWPNGVQKISKITYTASRFLLLTSAKFAMRAVCMFEQDKEFIISILYVMVLLCVICKSV